MIREPGRVTTNRRFEESPPSATDIRGNSKLRVRSPGVSCVECAFDTLLGGTKRLDEAGDVGQDWIGDWERLVKILRELVIDVVSARNVLFSKGSLTIGGELAAFLLAP
uniref:hypothetical protein n=1 Tax=Halococcus agarilyticus TaxID=1232219 RepID=UPI0012AB562F|nr:hypothetical protein [Halococcus agarilyticus]